MLHYKAKVLLALFLLSITCQPLTSWAGEWVQEEGGVWFYEEDQEILKGWQRIDGKWYCLDSQTGAWVQKPRLTPEAACHLLDNRLQEMGMYQYEEEELQYKVEYETDDRLKISVGYEEKPGVFHTLNTYEINRKNGIADPVVGKEEIGLW